MAAIILWLLVASACSVLLPPAAQVEPTGVVVTATPPQEVLPTSMETLDASPPVPSLTPMPTWTPTPTPWLLAESGTPLPLQFSVITAINADNVSGLAAWQEQAVTSLIWMPSGMELAVSTGDEIVIYDANNRTPIQRLEPEAEGIFQLAINRSNNWLLAASRREENGAVVASSLEVWRLSTLQPAGVLYGTTRSLAGVAFSNDDQLMMTAYTNPEIIGEGLLDFWRMRTLQITSTIQTGPLLQAIFAPDGKRFVTTPDRYALKIWDMKTKLPLLSIPTSFTGAVSSMAFAPNSATIVSGHYDGFIRMWEVSTGRLLWEVTTNGPVTSLDFNPDGTLLATGTAYDIPRVQIWAANSGQLLRTLEGHMHGIDIVRFSPEGDRIVSASYDGSLHLWGVRP